MYRLPAGDGHPDHCGQRRYGYPPPSLPPSVADARRKRRRAELVRGSSLFGPICLFSAASRADPSGIQMLRKTAPLTAAADRRDEGPDTQHAPTLQPPPGLYSSQRTWGPPTPPVL